MTIKEARTHVEKWNKHIDDFMVNDLPGILHERGINVVNGEIKLNDWFKAQQIIQEQNFFKKGYSILKKLRNKGFNIKMDMQRNTLNYYGVIERRWNYMNMFEKGLLIISFLFGGYLLLTIILVILSTIIGG